MQQKKIASQNQCNNPSAESGNARIFVISGPSGVGKGTLCKKLRSLLGEAIGLSISATSRPKRPGEQEGADYYFKSKPEFESMIQDNGLLEWADYNGHYYGTPKQSIVDMLASGQSVLLEIDLQGALQVKETFPEACLIFIEPPSLEILEIRLRTRNTNNEEDVRQRMAIAAIELENSRKCFETSVVNDDLEACTQTVLFIIRRYLL